MKTPEMGMGMPKQEKPEKIEDKTPKVEIKYSKPGYYTDGDGNLEITIGKKSKKIKFNSKYFKEEVIDNIQLQLENAKNSEEREEIFEKIKKALEDTKLGGSVAM